MIKRNIKKKKCKKTKWLPEEALKISEKKREAKGKGEKQRYTQRTARRDKKAFLNAKKKKKTIEWERVEISSRIKAYKTNSKHYPQW